MVRSVGVPRKMPRRHVVGDVTAGVAVGGHDAVKFLQHGIVSEGFRDLFARRRVLTAHGVDHRTADPLALRGIGGVGQRRIDLGRRQGRRPWGVWAYRCARAEPPRAAEDRLAERDIAVTATHTRREVRIPLGNGRRAAQTCKRGAEQGGSAAGRMYEATHRDASPRGTKIGTALRRWPRASPHDFDFCRSQSVRFFGKPRAFAFFYALALRRLPPRTFGERHSCTLTHDQTSALTDGETA
jgi:hypothetical protein